MQALNRRPGLLVDLRAPAISVPLSAARRRSARYRSLARRPALDGSPVPVLPRAGLVLRALYRCRRRLSGAAPGPSGVGHPTNRAPRNQRTFPSERCFVARLAHLVGRTVRQSGRSHIFSHGDTRRRDPRALPALPSGVSPPRVKRHTLRPMSSEILARPRRGCNRQSPAARSEGGSYRPNSTRFTHPSRAQLPRQCAR